MVTQELIERVEERQQEAIKKDFFYRGKEIINYYPGSSKMPSKSMFENLREIESFDRSISIRYRTYNSSGVSVSYDIVSIEYNGELVFEASQNNNSENDYDCVDVKAYVPGEWEEKFKMFHDKAIDAGYDQAVEDNEEFELRNRFGLKD